MTHNQPSLSPLVVSQLTHRYHHSDRAVLSGLSLSINPGEFLCLVGDSGCGKSTLLRLIAGLLPTQQGSITMNGQVISDPKTHKPAAQRSVGLVFQDFALFPHMTILENIAFGLHRLKRAERHKQALLMLERIGLTERAHDRPSLLSGGQQQRVALARALAPNPHILLLDEPFSNLDINLRRRMRIATLQLIKAHKMAAIMVTHDAKEAMFMADRIALMHQGEIIQIDHPDALYSRPISPFAGAFFGDVNRILGIVQQGVVTTSIGATLAAPNLADGTQVDVLIRPEAIKLSNNPQGAIAAHIDARYLLGAETLLMLRINTKGQAPLTLEAHISSDQYLDGDTQTYIRLDQRGVFVFPQTPH